MAPSYMGLTGLLTLAALLAKLAVTALPTGNRNRKPVMLQLSVCPELSAVSVSRLASVGRLVRPPVHQEAKSSDGEAVFER